MFLKIFETSASISDQWSLAAFAIAAILYLVLKRRGTVGPIAWASILAIVLLGLVPILASVYVDRTAIYRVRVTVLDPQQSPVDDAKVWSSVGGEGKRVAGGWQFDIPAAAKPVDGKLTVYAAVPSAFLTGRCELQLTHDRNPSLVVRLARDSSGTIRGIVIDSVSNEAIVGARVSVVGYESEAVVTQAGGNFQLPAHAAKGQQVRLHWERKGYVADSTDHPAGDFPATLTLHRK